MHGKCPSSWHSHSERHSPLFPSSHQLHQYKPAQRRNTWSQCSQIPTSCCNQKPPSQNYCMYLNGMKFGTNPVCHKHSTSTMYFHGQVTTFESNESTNNEPINMHEPMNMHEPPASRNYINIQPPYHPCGQIHNRCVPMKPGRSTYDEESSDNGWYYSHPQYKPKSCLFEETPSQMYYQQQNPHCHMMRGNDLYWKPHQIDLPSIGSFLDYLHNI